MNSLYRPLLCFLFCIIIFSACSTFPKGDSQQNLDEKVPEIVSDETKVDEDLPYLQYEKLEISQGEYADKIVISWAAEEKAAMYHLYRSNKLEEEYVRIAEVSEATIYEDTNLEPGLKVYYRLVSLNKDELDAHAKAQQEMLEGDGQAKELKVPDSITEKEASDEFEFDDTSIVHFDEKIVTPEKEDEDHKNYGYVKIEARPSGKSFEKLEKTYTRGKTSFKTKEEREQAAKDLKYIKEKYMHPVQLNMILIMVRPYLNDKRLEAFTGFKSYGVNDKKKEVYLFGEDHSYAIIFNSGYITRRLRKPELKHLMETLMYNSVAFSRFVDEKEVIDENGYERIVPAFDTLALACQYYPKYKNWKNETVILLTSRKELRSELQKAQRNR